MIKAILFDVDGVLMDTYEANFKFYNDLLKTFSYPPVSREVFQTMVHLTMQAAIRALTKSVDEELIAKIFEAGQSRDTLYDTSLIKLPDSLKEVLDDLQRKYRLGIVSSRLRENIFEVPALAVFKDYFDVIVGYQDTKNHKPYPDPIVFACDQLGIKPNEAVYIGDTEHDMAAAHSAGMPAIVYSPKVVDGAEAQTNMFSDLPALIARLEI